MLKSSLATGIAAAAGVACSNQDSEVFAGAVAETLPTTTTTSVPATTTTSADSAEPASSAPAVATDVGVAVAGEMVISFTYTRVGEGKIESPYIAVWIEDAEGELLQTVSLWYEQSRRGARWLDHLDRWYAVDTARVAAGGPSNSSTISTATRPPGSHAVAWDGNVDGVPASAGEYFVNIESAREDGPYSLIRVPLSLRGALLETLLPDEGELSEASVRIDA